MAADTDFRLLAFTDNGLGRGNPAFDLFLASEGFISQVNFLQQALIVPAAGVDPLALDVCQRHRIQFQARGARDVGLDGNVVPVCIFDVGGRFHLDHSPDLLAFSAHGQQHVHVGTGTASVESGLKQRALRVDQCGRAADHLVIALHLWLKNHALAFGVV